VTGDNVYRCDWCGRFYSSALPEGSACPNHIPEHNERLAAQIARHNEKLKHACCGGPAFHAECWSCVSLIA
jgi:hypothetical protein